MPVERVANHFISVRVRKHAHSKIDLKGVNITLNILLFVEEGIMGYLVAVHLV